MPANFDLHANKVTDYNIYSKWEENTIEKKSSGYWCLVCGEGFKDLHAYTAHNELLHDGKTAWSASLKTAPRASTSRDSSQPLLPIPSSMFATADVTPEHAIGAFDASASSTPSLAPITMEGGIYTPFMTDDGFEYAYSGIVDESAVIDLSEWESVRVNTRGSARSRMLEKAGEETAGNETSIHSLASVMEGISVGTSKSVSIISEVIPPHQESPVKEDQPLPTQQNNELEQTVQIITPASVALSITSAATEAEEVLRRLREFMPGEVPELVAGYQSHWQRALNIQIDGSSAQMVAVAVAHINATRARSTMGTEMPPTASSSQKPLTSAGSSSGAHTRYSPYTVPYHHTALYSTTSPSNSDTPAHPLSPEPVPVPNLVAFTSLEVEADRIRGEITRYRESREGMEDMERQ